MFVRLAASLVLFGLFAVPTKAQQFDRRARDEPEVAVEHGGRTGTCDVIRFSPNGDFLFAAGDDKVVRVWPHTATGLDTAPGKASTLHWRSWRDQLGGIKAIGISPDGKRVAVGGYGLRVSSVAIIDRDSGETLAITWPRVREGGANYDAVMTVNFHPDGKRIGFGTADGSLWLWEPVKLDEPALDGRVWSAPVRAGRFEPTRNKKGEEKYNFPRDIHFPDWNKLVSVSLNGQVLACDLRVKLTDDPDVAPPAGTTLFDVNDGVKPKFPVNQVEWTADGKWLAIATKGNLVLLRSADGKRMVPIELPKDHFARSLAIDAKGEKLAIGVGGALPGKSPRFYMEGNDEIWLYAKPTAEKLPPANKIRHAGRAEALAFHPDGNRLAVAGGDADEITLLDLANPGKPISVVRGAGRRLHAVNLSDDGNVIGVRTGRNTASLDPNDRGDGPWVRFNIPRFTPTADANVKWVGVMRESGGWTIVPDEKSRFVWHAKRAKPGGGEESLRLGLDRDLDQAPTCFTFLPPAEGQPPRVLVGTYYGCSLFELDPAGAKNPTPRSRNCRGRSSSSATARKSTRSSRTARRVVRDRRVGSDRRRVEPQGLGRATGARGCVQVRAGNLAVSAVDVGSPAWEAGLRRTTRLIFCRWTRSSSTTGGQATVKGNVAAAARRWRTHSPGSNSSSVGRPGMPTA